MSIDFILCMYFIKNIHKFISITGNPLVLLQIESDASHMIHDQQYIFHFTCAVMW